MQQIDSHATYERIRARHGSVRKYFLAKGWSGPLFYMATTCQRGTTARQSISKSIRETLKKEDLLVEVNDVT